MLLQPRYIALDSAHLIQWADARVSAHAPRRAEARRFELWLERHGYVPLLSLHHIAEMANHAVEAVAAGRLRFLAGLPLVAWIGAPPQGGAGTVVTLIAEEVRAACTAPQASRSEVRDLAKPRLIQAGAGTRMLGAAPEAWLALRPVFAAEAEQARKVVAFTRVGTVDISKKPMAELLNSRLRRGEDLRRQLDLMTGTYAASIAQRADRRIADPDAMAAAFMGDVAAMASPLPETAAELVLRALATQGVTADDITPTSTIGDMLDLGLFRAQLRIAAEAAGVSPSEALLHVQPERIPSWSLVQALQRHLPDLPEREGGELNDTYLACLAAYADVTLVDKRTWEGVRRLRAKAPELAALLGRVERLPRFEQLAAVLGE
ncbi:hypothetical protein [Phenylobacterium sp.]|uniref:hypothetical protein n=1 Tax=Phenylobacterium sp. TaxID=1871053 RepID=UPI002FDB5107